MLKPISTLILLISTLFQLITKSKNDVINRKNGLMLKPISTLFQLKSNPTKSVKIGYKGQMLKPISTLFLFISTVYHSNSQTLDTYLEIAIENNPGIRASFKGYEASLEKVNQANSLPDPELNVGYFLRPMELLMGNQRAEASVMQMFPWFGMLKTQKDEATLMAEARYEAFKEERNRLMLQVKETYFQLQQLENTIAVTQSNLEILKSLERLAIIRFQGGNTSEAVSSVSSAVRKPSQIQSSGSSSDSMGMGGSSPAARTTPSSPSSGMNAMGATGSSGKLTDVLRLQVQIKALQSELIQMEVNKKPFIAKFNQLLGVEQSEKINLSEKFEPINIAGLEELMLEGILTNNPMVLMLEKESEAYWKQAQMAKLEGRPMLGAGLNYMVFSPRPESGMIGGMDGLEFMPSGMGNNMFMVMGTVTLPIYRKKYKSMETEANYWRESVIKQKEDLQNSLITEFETAIAQLKDSQRKLELLVDQIDLTEQTMELSVTSYATDGSSFEEILSIQRELLDFRLELLNTQIEQQLNYARLEVLTGY